QGLTLRSPPWRHRPADPNLRGIRRPRLHLDPDLLGELVRLADQLEPPGRGSPPLAEVLEDRVAPVAPPPHPEPYARRHRRNRPRGERKNHPVAVRLAHRRARS